MPTVPPTPPPLFLAFLEQIFPGDADYEAEHLRSYFQYPREAQLILGGSGTNGKSALEKILRAAVPSAIIFCANNIDHGNPGQIEGVPPGHARYFLHFHRVFKPEEQDPLVADRIIAAEVDLIRAWALAR
jgi:hypothetical protein